MVADQRFNWNGSGHRAKKPGTSRGKVKVRRLLKITSTVQESMARCMPLGYRMLNRGGGGGGGGGRGRGRGCGK